MAEVTIRRVTASLRTACERLEVAQDQRAFIADNARSMVQASEDPATRIPLAVYDVAARGWIEPREPMIGFAMLEVVAGVGFIERLMIDHRFQRRGYGGALLDALVRRLRLTAEVEMIATSHRRANLGAAALFAGRGFEPWAVAFASENADEVFLRLP